MDSTSQLELRVMSVDERETFLSLQGRSYAESLLKAGLYTSFESALEHASTQNQNDT
jgi:hypothetical protein